MVKNLRMFGFHLKLAVRTLKNADNDNDKNICVCQHPI